MSYKTNTSYKSDISYKLNKVRFTEIGIPRCINLEISIYRVLYKLKYFFLLSF